MAAATVTVEMGFGYGPGDVVSSWTDVSQWVHLEGSETLSASSGRQQLDSISPGRLTFRLDNADRRWDPTYTAGPYYGDLVAGVPVRVRTTYSATTRTRWSGFVSSGWAQPVSSTASVVSVEAHDLFGQMAAADGPTSAWDASVPLLSPAPEQWWRPGVDGWIDRIGKRRARQTSALVDTDTLVAGGDASWGQADPDGCGLTEDTTLLVDPDNDRVVISFWLRIQPRVDGNFGTRVPIFTQGSAVEGFHTIRVYAWQQGIAVLVSTPGYGVSYYTQDPQELLAGVVQSGPWWIADGEPHHVLIVVDEPTTAGWARTPEMEKIVLEVNPSPGLSTGPQPHIWIDGIEPHAYGLVTKPGSGVAPGVPVKFGGDFQINGFSESIDHMLVWGDHSGTDADVADLAAELNALGREAWAGENLDERLARIINAVGYGNRLGTLDSSGIKTLQGYRQARVMDLLQKIEDTEQGRIWVDRDGDLRFSKRSWAWTDTTATTVQLTLSDVPSELAGGAQEMVEAGTRVNFDPYAVTNVAQVTSTYGRMQTVEDDTSIAQVGARNPVHLSGLLHPSDRQSLSIAEWIVYSRSTPQPRVEQVSFLVETNPSVLAPIAQQIEEGWLVRVILSPPLNSAGSPIGSNLDIQAHVIGVRHEINAFGWTVTLLLDSTRAGRTWFRAGVSLVGGSDLIAF